MESDFQAKKNNKCISLSNKDCQTIDYQENRIKQLEKETLDLRQKLTKVMQSRNEFLASYLNDKVIQDDKNLLYEQNHE